VVRSAAVVSSDLARVGKRVVVALGVLFGCGCGRSPLPGGPLLLDGGSVAAAGSSSTIPDAGAPLAGAGGVSGATSVAGRGGASAGFAGQAGAATAGTATTTWLDPPDSTSTAAAYQVNSAHTGAQPADHLTLPLSERWHHDFGTTALSYPLVARGRVFIVANNALYALELANGNVAWGPVSLGGTADSSHPAYERGRVFTVGSTGSFLAFSADDGSAIWSMAVKDASSITFRKTLPVVYQGVLYVGADDRLFAVDGAGGAVKWTLPTESCWTSGAAVGPEGAFVACICGFVYGADVNSGAERWSFDGGCTGGGGGATVLLAGGFVYTRDQEGNVVFDAETGAPVGTVATGPIPATAGDSLYAVNDGVLFAHRRDSADPVWSFGAADLTTAPLVVGEHVVVGSEDGVLSVLDARSGKLLSEQQLPAGFAVPNERVDDESPPMTGFAAAEDHLVITNGSQVRVY